MTVDLAALIARVEASEGASREMDAEIWRATDAGVSGEHGLVHKPWRYIGGGVWADDSDPSGCNKVRAPRFTASLDDAVSLVPEGWGYIHHKYPDGSANAFVYECQDSPHDNVGAATPALALCAAALRAREAARDA